MGGSGQLGNQEEPHNHYRKRLFSRENNLIAMKSRMNREVHVRIRERLEVKILWPTRSVYSMRYLSETRRVHIRQSEDRGSKKPIVFEASLDSLDRCITCPETYVNIRNLLLEEA